jgi:hypothetical protein
LDSVLQLTARTALLCLLALAASAGCASERLVAREVLADPLMRFDPVSPELAANDVSPPPARPLATDTVQMYVRTQADPGDQIQGLWLTSGLRTAVEVYSGLGLEAGYGVELNRLRLFKLDGYAGPLDFERLRHGPEAALVYDDGTSLVRVGYRFRTAFDGDLHEPSISARTLVLSSDTVVELGYRRSMNAIVVATADLPASEPIDDASSADRVHAALEQGFLPGINLRLDVVGLLERGFLQNPYRLVTLWSHWPQPAGEDPGQIAPRSQPETHPDARSRWGALARARFAIPAWSAAFELGAGHGSGSWRVEHSQAQLAWLQRIGQRVALHIGGGLYHQTRASFYRDDYPDGPPGAYWSADTSLSSFVAWWTRLGIQLSLIPERGRLMGMFRYMNLELTGQLVRSDYNFEGLNSDNGVTRYAQIAAVTGREPFTGAWQFGGWFGLVAGF